jgi:hypothetical protein
MADPVWRPVALDFRNTGQAGNVIVETLHWEATMIEGEFSARRYGAMPDDSNRVYTLPALENVPADVVEGWIKDALGPEEVARIEQALADDIAEQQNPTSGSITYGGDDGAQSVIRR